MIPTNCLFFKVENLNHKKNFPLPLYVQYELQDYFRPATLLYSRFFPYS
jgi:hypothetical protein